MSRPLRIEYPGAVYHLTSRGNARQEIFTNDKDRQLFLETLAATIDRFGWLCHAYCLMGNHYHLLVETPNANLSRGMRQLNGVYTQRFNRRRHRCGHVFQGRYKAVLVEKESHLLELARYVVLNPVRAGMAKEAAQWRWSSYGATCGENTAPPWLETRWLLSCFGGTQAEQSYRAFVAEGAGVESPWEGLAEHHVLGGKTFVASVQEKVRDNLGSGGGEIPKRQRHLTRPDLSDLRERHRERGEWMARAYREHGYTMNEIAAEAGLHYSSVSKIIKTREMVGNSQFK